MNFSNKIKYIMKAKGLNNKDLAREFGVKEPLVSKWINKDEPSIGLINHLVKKFPDIDLNFLFKDEVYGKVYEPLINNNIVEEDEIEYKKSSKNELLILEIEERLQELKKIVAQNSHK